ncbi:hypothetical protein MGYG_09152 [Nannizzia gypsea CBS 118893]|uniref:Uncharacterized protein n=1 Tax=Arthroderma gypseum (strain ATCC MYA-4604 / CBS 118893) TaxID=535722 RepID=E4V317_ARTGP|nr:hypothetical protein MGYG_09152 [Nannizzia gypsea CBS 118893]EFR04391.1 hypothetical protein MGYG_09152 [Nannizzia gypsea CBS 118893]
MSCHAEFSFRAGNRSSTFEEGQSAVIYEHVDGICDDQGGLSQGISNSLMPSSGRDTPQTTVYNAERQSICIISHPSAAAVMQVGKNNMHSGTDNP